MFKNLIIVIAILFYPLFLHTQEKKPNKIQQITTPVIDVIPSVIILEKDTTEFVVINVEVLNRGIGVLNIKSVTGSCYCSNAVIEKNDIRFLDTGKIRLEINKTGLDDKNDSVVYTITSNSQNSSYYITVKFINKIPNQTKK